MNRRSFLRAAAAVVAMPFVPVPPAVMVDVDTGIAIHPLLRFHPKAFSLVMLPLEPSRPFSRADLADVEAVVLERWMSKSDFERSQFSAILEPAGRPTGEARGS